MICLTKHSVETFTWMYFGYCIIWAQPSSLPEAKKDLKNELKTKLCWKNKTGRSAAFEAKSFVFILVTSCHFTPSSIWEVSVIPTNNRAQTLPWRLPVTTQVNFTLQFSETAFDFKVVSKDGCMSSVSWAMTLHNVLLKGIANPLESQLLASNRNSG